MLVLVVVGGAVLVGSSPVAAAGRQQPVEPSLQQQAYPARSSIGVVAAPIPPSSYAVPAGALYVTTSRELVDALAAVDRDIVLADGVYDNGTPFDDPNGDRIFAEHLGGATLKAGLVLGGNFGSGGGSVQGVVFDISDTSKVLGGAIVHIWGAGGIDSRVTDCVFRGHGVVPAGLKAYQPAGLVAQRLQFFGFTDFGMLVTDNKTVPYGSATPRGKVISDIYVDGVSRPVPGSSDGRAEQGVQVGNPIVDGVHRIEVRNTAWDGLETANNSWDTTFSDLNIDMSGSFNGVGIYLEHYSYHDTFERFLLRGCKIGVDAEWNDPLWSSRAAAHFTTIANGTIDSAGWGPSGGQAGVYLQPGTESTTITGVVFRNMRRSGIIADETAGVDGFRANDFSGLRFPAVRIMALPIE